MKGVELALCGMKCVNLKHDSIKILGICYSYNQKLSIEQNFLNHISKLQKIIQLWRLRNLSILGKITIFKTLAISKIIHLALVTYIPTSIIDILNKLQKEFLWNKKNPKIKHSTLCSDYENGGLKSVDISSKIVELQCSWIKRLFDGNFHEWKIISALSNPQILWQKF